MLKGREGRAVAGWRQFDPIFNSKPTTMSKTEIIIALDSSSSMHGTEKSVKEGLKTILLENKETDALITIVQFATEWESLVWRKPIKKLEEDFIEKYRPSGMTALQDCICTTMDKLGREYANIAPDKRPRKVLFFVVSDGDDTFSKKYSPEDLKQRIEHQRTKYNWVFQYLGTDHDAITTGGKYGFAAAHTTTFLRGNSKEVFKKMSSRVSYTSQANVSAADMAVNTVYSPADIADLNKEHTPALQEDDNPTKKSLTKTKKKSITSAGDANEADIQSS